MYNNLYTIGLDVGGNYIKGVLIKFEGSPKIIVRKTEKIRKRNPAVVVDELVSYLLNEQSKKYEDIAYVASTGDAEIVKNKHGHFYSMTTHARGGIFLSPETRTIVDMGALYSRAVKINDMGKVIDYKMTGQCASGSGQFIENISRYLGLSIEEVGQVSLQSANPELPSGICAVLAETDVINMVSRDISTPDIIKGIHLSIANKIVRLLSSLNADSPILLTGGMAMNEGMVQAVTERAKAGKLDVEIKTHPDAIYAGAIGAAIWGEYRYKKLQMEMNVQT